MAYKAHFLWVDDEIDLLIPHMLFLKEKGYETDFANNGRDAIAMCQSKAYDIIFLDEHMPGLSGLNTLSKLKETSPTVPVVMITKSEDEGIMNKAIGKKISDYLIKPVNPNQILLAIKKILEKEQLISETTTLNYREEYNKLNLEINNCRSIDDWRRLYRKLIYWEIELEQSGFILKEFPEMQKNEANILFAKFVKNNYKTWVSRIGNPTDKDREQPIMSPNIFERYVYPMLDSNEKLFFILIDNFRLDQWEVIKGVFQELFTYKEDLYFSILPTATPYARNSLFSGMMPKQLADDFPEMWVSESEDVGKNDFEDQLIKIQLSNAERDTAFSYNKINTNKELDRITERFQEYENNQLNVLVFNFIDMLSHSRTESKMLSELIFNESSFRKLTLSWFQNSSFQNLLRLISQKGFKAIVTSDHGSIRVKNGVKIVGDKGTNNNLRYKLGKSLGYDPKKVFEIIHPENYGLPSPNMSTRYIFAQNRDFFIYPNNYNYFISIYENSFQHGGISMEEMMLPIISLSPK